MRADKYTKLLASAHGAHKHSLSTNMGFSYNDHNVIIRIEMKKMNSTFKALRSQCPRLNDLLKDRKEGKLEYDHWNALVRLFINAGRIDLARKFTRLPNKRNYEWENEVDILSFAKKGKDVLCTELGCTAEDITRRPDGVFCFNKHGLRLDKNENPTNSPASKVAMKQEEKKSRGFIYDEEKFSNVEPNEYARHILKNYKLMYHDSGLYYVYYNHYWQPLSGHKIKKVLREFFHKFEENRWTSQTQGTYMSALSYECRDMEQFQSAENYINVKNGLLDISGEKLKLKQHNSNIFSTVQIPINYDPAAECKEFKKFLDTTFEGDEKLIELVQEIMGYCLCNSVKAHKLFFFLGEGSNGKSVLCEIMTELAGGVKNVSNVALKDLKEKFSRSQIVDKTVNISTENETEKTLDTQLLKMIASGDPIQIEEKFQNPYSYKPFVKLVFAMNDLPYVKDRSYGFERRIIIVPFEMQFVPHEPRPGFKEAKIDRNLADRVIKNELSGVFAYAMEGLARLRENDFEFTEAEKSLKALEEYKEQLNVYLLFVRQFVTQADDEKYVLSDGLWKKFTGWCTKEGHSNAQKVNSTTFIKNIKRAMKNEGILTKPDQFSVGDKRLRGLRGIIVKGLNDAESGSYAVGDEIDDFIG